MGGDYFDFVDGGQGRLGLVLGDVSGKGLAAALLMASLRPACGRCRPWPETWRENSARDVNRLLVESTEPSRYATLFLGEYDDATRRLRYVNCGHNPPVLLRADGQVERLQPTAMVIGLVEPWTCDVGEVVLDPGDLLVAYSDGISEATDERDQEFGEERLLAHRRRLSGGAAARAARRRIRCGPALWRGRAERRPDPPRRARPAQGRLLTVKPSRRSAAGGRVSAAGSCNACSEKMRR